MGDYYYGRIYIKGGITQEQFLGLVEHLQDNPHGFQDGVGEKKEDLLLAISAGDMWFDDGEAKNGMFDDFEQFLKENFIPFQRYSSAFMEYSACLTTFDGVKEYEIACTDQQEPYITLSELKELTEEGKSAADAIAVIREKCPDLPDLHLIPMENAPHTVKKKFGGMT